MEHRTVAAPWCGPPDPVDCNGVCLYADPSQWYRLYLLRRTRYAGPVSPSPKDPLQSDTSRLCSWLRLVRTETHSWEPECCPYASWKFLSRVAEPDLLPVFPPTSRRPAPCPQTRSSEQTERETGRCRYACGTPVSVRGNGNKRVEKLWKIVAFNKITIKWYIKANCNVSYF